MELYERLSITLTPGEKGIENDDKVTLAINYRLMEFYNKNRTTLKEDSIRIINVQHYTEPSAPNSIDPYSIEGVMIIVNIAYRLKNR